MNMMTWQGADLADSADPRGDYKWNINLLDLSLMIVNEGFIEMVRLAAPLSGRFRALAFFSYALFRPKRLPT